MVKKKNSKVIDNNDNMDKEIFIKETERIYNAIQNNDIDLSSKEKANLMNDIQTILNELDGDEELLNNFNNLNSITLDESDELIHSFADRFNKNNYVKGESNLIFEKSVDDSIGSNVQHDSDIESLDDVSSENKNFSNTQSLNDQKSKEGSNLIFEKSVDDSIGSNVQHDSDIESLDDVSSENKNFLNTQSLNDQKSEKFDVTDALNELIDDYSEEMVINVKNVSMDYKVSKDKIDTFKEFFIRTIKRNKTKSKSINALKNVSFEISKGDRVGIIGFNGAGKSTLLKLIAGIYEPTSGIIEIKGKIAPLLELGAGFDDNYTGKANIFLNGAFLGYSEEFLKEKYDEIVEFSELGDAINYHIKTYSSGMRAKLGFSIATIVEPDILIIDEILSVGDIKFRRKSADKIKSLINSGVTVLLVSHSVGQIRELCNKVIWLDNGELKMFGDVNKVCDEYVNASSTANKEQLKNIELN